MDGERDAVEDLFALAVALVAEAGVAELDPAAEAFEGDGLFALDDLILRIDEAEDLFAGADGLLEAVVIDRHFADGIVEHDNSGEKGDKGADRPVAMHDSISTEHEEQSDGDGTEGVHERRGDGLHGDRTHIGRE